MKRAARAAARNLQVTHARTDRLMLREPDGRFLLRSAMSADALTLWIYDVIDPYWGEISAKDIAQQLAADPMRDVYVRINSPGGDVFEAQAIATALRQHKGNVLAQIDGVAASAATVIALAAKQTLIATGSFFMIHKAWAFAAGNADEMTKLAELLTKADDSLAGQYAAKCGKPKQELMAAMAEETWYTAQEAVDAGLCDALLDALATEQARAAANFRIFDLSMYRKAPKDIAAPAPSVPKADASAMHCPDCPDPENCPGVPKQGADAQASTEAAARAAAQADADLAAAVAVPAAATPAPDEVDEDPDGDVRARRARLLKLCA